MLVEFVSDACHCFRFSLSKINKVVLFYGNAGVECVAVARVIGIIMQRGNEKGRLVRGTRTGSLVEHLFALSGYTKYS